MFHGGRGIVLCVWLKKIADQKDIWDAKRPRVEVGLKPNVVP